jgi:thioredoxin 1
MGTGFDSEVRYEMSLSPEEAGAGTKKLLNRQGKKLEVTIPPGSREGTAVRLTNALLVTDGRPGDILITVRIKDGGTGVIEIDESSFEREVNKSSLPVVVDFWAPWCGPCRMISPIMEKLSGQYSGRLKFCKINVDENPAPAARYQAMSIPLLVFFKGGEEIDRSVGALSVGALRQKIDSILG